MMLQCENCEISFNNKPGAMVIRLETEGNCWGLEKPKKIMKFGRHAQDVQSLLKPWTKLQW